MSNKKKRRALKRTETTTWIDELKELDPASLKMLEETICRPTIPNVDMNKPQKYTDVISAMPDSVSRLGKYSAAIIGARPFPSIMESIRHLQEIEADCPRPGQMLDGYEVIGGMWVQDHYIVKLKPRKK